MCDSIEHDGRILDTMKETHASLGGDLPAVALKAPERRALERRLGCRRFISTEATTAFVKKATVSSFVARLRSRFPGQGPLTHFLPSAMDQGANSRTGYMIGGLVVGIGRALGFDQCLLLYGRIVGCQQNAIREECLS